MERLTCYIVEHMFSENNLLATFGFLRIESYMESRQFGQLLLTTNKVDIYSSSS